MEQSLFINQQKRKKSIILSVITGIILVLSFPKFNFEILAWGALVPMLVAIDGKDSLHSFFLGFISGFVFFLGTLYWIVNTMVSYGNLNVFVSYLILIFLILYLSLYFGFGCFLISVISHYNPIIKWLAAPFIWTSLEMLRCHLFSGFPWVSLGYSQFKFLEIIQISDITGIYGITFLIVMVNSTIGYIIENFDRKSETNRITEVRQVFNPKPVVLALMIFCLCYVYGFLRIDEAIYLEAGSHPVKIKIVQGNIDQNKKWDDKHKEDVFKIYSDLTLSKDEDKGQSKKEKNLKKSVDLTVWPETATPFYFSNNKKYQKKMFELASESDVFIFFGSPRYILNGETLNMFNSSYFISPDFKILGKYDKIHLVPFGEYVPFSKYLWFINKMVDGIGDFIDGKEHTVFSIQETKFSSLICFEIIFPDLVRRFVKGGAQFLINITNDAWFGRSAASYQHISMVALRAVENRVPIVRSANTGISAFITSYGKIEKATDIFIPTTITNEIIPRFRKNTFYTKYGDIFTYMCILFLFFLGFTFFLRDFK